MSGCGGLRYLLNDFVVQEQICNLRCAYCLNFENRLKDVEPWAPQARLPLGQGERGFARAKRALDAARAAGDAPIVKISGGEIFALPGAVEFIESIAPEWDRVQVLTNGTLLGPDRRERLGALGNLNYCVSLDGHTPEANILRTANAKLAGRIIETVEALTRAGAPVEVYTVVSSANVGALSAFVDWLVRLPRRADLRFIPFPVRGEAAKASAPDPEFARSALLDLVERHADYAEILLPRPYYEALTEFYSEARRTRRCRVPLTHVQTFDDGVIAACPNCWASHIGNLVEDDAPFRNVGEAKIHKLFLRTPPRVPFCRGCFTPFDLVNLYLDDRISLTEMTKIDLFSTPAVASRLASLQDHVGGSELPVTALYE